MANSLIVSDPSYDGPAFKFGTGVDGVAAYYDAIPDVGSPVSAWHLAQWHTVQTLDPTKMLTHSDSETDNIFGLPDYSWKTDGGEIAFSVYGEKNNYGYRITSNNGVMHSDGSQNIFLETSANNLNYSFDHPIIFEADEALTAAHSGGLAQQVLNGFTVVFNAVDSKNYDSSIETQSVFLQSELSDSRGYIPQYKSISQNSSIYNISGEDSIVFSPSKSLYHIKIDLNHALTNFIRDYGIALPSGMPKGFSNLSNWTISSTYIGLETTDGGGASLDVQHVKLQSDTSQLYKQQTGKIITIASDSANLITATALKSVSGLLSGSPDSSTFAMETLNTASYGSLINLTKSGTVISNGPDRINCGSSSTIVNMNGSGATVVGSVGKLSVVGGSGNNTVFAGTGGLYYQGGSGFDTVNGLGCPLTVVGGTGGGLFFGGGNSSITAGSGGKLNVVIGGNGDKLYGSGPSGVLFGTSGGDVLMSTVANTATSVFFGAAGTGHMTFLTGSGDDLMALGQNVNDVTLGSGHVTIFGNGGTTSKSTINAGAGSLDMAFSGAETELNIAASGARSFNLFSYTIGHAHIHLQNFAASQAADALANQKQVSGTTILNLSDGSRISLMGVAKADLSLFN